MSREIKFRVWDKLKKVYITERIGEYISIALGYGFSSICICRDDLVLQRFTGLKGKNGVEVYEGDIVRQFVTVNECSFEERNLEVKFRNVYNHEQCICGFYAGDFSISRGCEIIGNVFENPELLEK